MKYVIVILIFLAVSFFFGMALGKVSSNGCDDDEEQEEYLRRWAEEHRKNGDHA